MITCPACLNTKRMMKVGYRKTGHPPYFRCYECRTLLLHPMPNNLELRIYYEKLAEFGSYSKTQTSFRDQSILDFLDNCLTRPDGRNWLDYGCFDGYLLKNIQARGFVGFGVEIQNAARLSAQAIANGKVVDVLEKNSINERIDIVSMKDSIEHLTNPDQVFLEILNVTDSNAEIFIQTPNATSFSSFILKKNWACLNSPEHTIIFSEKGLTIFLDRNGWEVQRVKVISKFLTFEYVLMQLENFGSYQSQARFLRKILPNSFKNLKLRFFGGEFFVKAIRKVET